MDGILETYSTFLADGIWWDVAVTGYIRVGGALDGLLCGCSCLLLYRDVGHYFWAVGPPSHTYQIGSVNGRISLHIRIVKVQILMM